MNFGLSVGDKVYRMHIKFLWLSHCDAVKVWDAKEILKNQTLSLMKRECKNVQFYDKHNQFPNDELHYSPPSGNTLISWHLMRWWLQVTHNTHINTCAHACNLKITEIFGIFPSLHSGVAVSCRCCCFLRLFFLLPFFAHSLHYTIFFIFILSCALTQCSI